LLECLDELASLDRPGPPHYALAIRLTRPGSLNDTQQDSGDTMTIYELRTYTLQVGKMAEAVKLYTELGYPALQRGGQDKKLIGYFQADTGTVNQLVHLWKFDDDADRRAHWASVFANKDFVEGFAVKFRPLLVSQEVKLLTAAPWGPHP
jgi:NIPSNAP